MAGEQHELTGLLRKWGAGDQAALDQLRHLSFSIEAQRTVLIRNAPLRLERKATWLSLFSLIV